MNPAVAGLAARHASHAGLQLVGAACGLVLFASVALVGGFGGMGAALRAATGSAASFTAGSSAVGVPSGAPELSVAEIGTLAERAGFTGSGLVMAIAVALAESGGNPEATDYDSNGTVDRGVWQINSVHSQYSATCDDDPACAASAAFSLSAGGTDWAAWVTYQHGAEIAFLPVAVSFAEGTGAPKGGLP